MLVYGFGRGFAFVISVAASVLLGAACGRRTGTNADRPPSNIQIESNLGIAWKLDPSASNFPVPVADGPKIAPLAMAVPVRSRPDRASDVVGLLRVGARVSRSVQSVSARECPGGWYAIRPVGFVCSGVDVTTELKQSYCASHQCRTRPLSANAISLRISQGNSAQLPKGPFEGRAIPI